MVVAVGLIALLAVMALPRLAAGLRLGGTERAVRIIDAGVTAARERAVSTRRPHALVVDLDQSSVRVEEEVSASDGAVPAAVDRGVSLPDGIRTAVWTAGTLRRVGLVRIVARPDGRVAPARFYFNDAPALTIHPLTGLVEAPSAPVAATAPSPPPLP